jgi:hypothetical protein
MLIKGLSVEGIGRFTKLTQVEGFSNGVNVLAAGNEAGKSTLFRAIRACLFFRHDSKGQEIRDLATENSQLPASVELSFEHSGRNYAIRKSFLRSPAAVLSENGSEIARSKQADEALWDLIGVGPGTGRTVDDGAFGVLWVGQGSSFTVPTPSPAASSTLNSAIESEVGALIGGERARKTVEDINAELRRSLTDTDRLRNDGPLYRATSELEQCREVEAQTKQKLSALEHQFIELAKLRDNHRELTNPTYSNQLAGELAQARADLEAGRIAVQEILRLEAEEKSARRALDVAIDRLRQHREVAARIDSSRRLGKNLSESLPEQIEREQHARFALEHTQQQLAEIELQLRSMSTDEHKLGKLLNAAVRSIAKGEHSRRLAALESAAAALIQLEAEIAQIAIEKKHVDYLNDYERKITSLEAQLSAVAAQLDIEVSPSGEGKVTIGKLQPKGIYSSPIVTPTKIQISDLAVVSVTPAPNAGLDERNAIQEKESSLLKLLKIGSPAEARALLSRRQELEATRASVLTELKTLGAPKDPTTSISEAKNALAEIDATVQAALHETGREQLPPIKDIETDKLALEQSRIKLEARRASLEQTRETQIVALGEARDRRTGTESQLLLVQKAIEDDVTRYPDSARLAQDALLVSEVAVAESSLQNAAIVLEARRSTAADRAEIERREARCQRLEQAIKNQNDELIALEREIGRISGQIQAAGGDGIGEQFNAAQEQCLLAARELERVSERIASLKLLRDTIVGCLIEGRDRYFEPVRRHLRPYLNDLFPGSELEIGDNFTIQGIRRDRSEAFNRLSDGTQEQIAVLVRLAMGSMLSERGQTVPIILDDALVYSDDDRIRHMFDALMRAGRSQQVIILTCRMRTFAPLGGNTLRLHTLETH